MGRLPIRHAPPPDKATSRKPTRGRADPNPAMIPGFRFMPNAAWIPAVVLWTPSLDWKCSAPWNPNSCPQL